MSSHLPEPSHDAVMRAHLARLRELRPGLQLHCEDGCDACDMTAQVEIGAGIRMVVLLEGAVDVSYGMRRMALAHGRSGASAALVSLAEPDCFTRRARRGQYSRRLSLGLGGQWLDQACEGAAAPHELAAFASHHLAARCWQLTPRVAALAEQMVRPPPLNSILQHMYLESRALELASEAFAGLCGAVAAPAPEATQLPPREHRRLRELHAFLASGQADALSLDEIARHAGMNANTLQRQFRAVHGTTVFEHLRECRLQRARQALERDGVSVGQAALLAGYTSAANFATAYRRRFGMPPKLAKARV